MKHLPIILFVACILMIILDSACLVYGQFTKNISLVVANWINVFTFGFLAIWIYDDLIRKKD